MINVDGNMEIEDQLACMVVAIKELQTEVSELIRGVDSLLMDTTPEKLADLQKEVQELKSTAGLFS